MNYVALDPRAGAPLPGDLVWSALPGAPVQEHRPRWRWPRARAARTRATAPRLEACPTTTSSISPAASR